jgi:hypothetical protein
MRVLVSLAVNVGRSLASCRLLLCVCVCECSGGSALLEMRAEPGDLNGDGFSLRQGLQ